MLSFIMYWYVEVELLGPKVDAGLFVVCLFLETAKSFPKMLVPFLNSLGIYYCIANRDAPWLTMELQHDKPIISPDVPEPTVELQHDKSIMKSKKWNQTTVSWGPSLIWKQGGFKQSTFIVWEFLRILNSGKA